MAKEYGWPPRTTSQWLRMFAKDCEVDRHYSLAPWERIRLKARAQAFREAAEMIELHDTDAIDTKADHEGGEGTRGDRS